MHARFDRGRRAWPAIVALSIAIACHGDRAIAPGGGGTILLMAGGDQQAVAGELLPDDVSVLVVDRAGNPAPHVRVQWFPEDSGVADPPTGVSGADGVVRARWTLGPESGTHHLIVYANGYLALTVRADGTPPPLPLNTPTLLELTTADGSGQTVHPDFLDLRSADPLRAEFLAITPYPAGDIMWENPAIYTSPDRIRWTAPGFAINPVETPQRGYLSDPDIVYDSAAAQIRLYYRQVDRENEILMTHSSDAVTWSAPVLVAHARNHEIVSPTIVRRSATEWLMWAVNGHGGCNAPFTDVQLRRSADGITWSDPQPVQLNQQGFTPWHIEVQWIESRGEYWALYNGKTPESCSTPALFLATSPDGVTWTTFPSPMLTRGELPDLADIVYRSTFTYHPRSDVITFWFSGARYDGSRFVWRTMVQRLRRADVFTRIAAPLPVAVRTRLGALRAGVPLLMDPP